MAARVSHSSSSNVAAEATIRWLLKPTGNQDVRALVNGVLWPKESFASWDCEDGQAHNGAGLVEFEFAADVAIVRAELLTTNTNSFGTNPSVQVWRRDCWSPLLSCQPKGGLSVLYLAANSPVDSWPADAGRTDMHKEVCLRDVTRFSDGNKFPESIPIVLANDLKK